MGRFLARATRELVQLRTAHPIAGRRGLRIGQLGRDDALEFRRALERLGRPGQPSRCAAVVFGRHGQNGQAHYRVVLDIDFFAEA